ncbi:hypothetical protein HWV62_4313 [Athelia sp. TMB]|nr:hypothetical protein HWV62_4313 [Athelia sp. TMB]
MTINPMLLPGAPSAMEVVETSSPSPSTSPPSTPQLYSGMGGHGTSAAAYTYSGPADDFSAWINLDGHPSGSTEYEDNGLIMAERDDVTNATNQFESAGGASSLASGERADEDMSNPEETSYGVGGGFVAYRNF